MSGGHSEVVPRLPIPNRTVKRLSADDSADTCVKVGHRQTPHVTKPSSDELGFVLCTDNVPLPFAGLRPAPGCACGLCRATISYAPANVGRSDAAIKNKARASGLYALRSELAVKWFVEITY